MSRPHSIARQGLGKWVLPFLLILAVGTAWLITTRPAELRPEKATLALLIVWLGCVPLIIYLGAQHRAAIPFMPLVGLFYAVLFGLPLFTIRSQQLIVASRYRIEDVTEVALWLVAGALVGLYVGFYGGWHMLWRRIRSVQIPWNRGSPRLRLFAWTCLGLHLIFYAIPALDNLPSVGQLLEPIGYLGWGMILVFWFEGALPGFEKCLLAPLGLFAELVFRSSTGLLSTTTIFLLYLSIVAFRFRPRRAIVLLGTAVSLLLLLSPIKAAYRQLVWYGSNNLTSPLERAKLLFSLAYDHYILSGFTLANAQNANAVAELSQRVSAISIFSEVVEMTPAQVPYWGGETYHSLWTKMIPRFIWPEKPREVTGNEFGRRYGFLDDWDTITSQNLPWIVELYANFGPYGLLFGMAAIGLFLAFLNRLFNSHSSNPIEYVYGATLLTGLIYQESSFALMVGNVFLLSVVLLVALRLVSNPSSASNRR